jgi:hypothetical protein
MMVFAVIFQVGKFFAAGSILLPRLDCLFLGKAFIIQAEAHFF